MTKIIFASKNKGKIKEANEILKDFPYEVISMSEAGVDIDVVEDGETFEENAMKKAAEIMRITGSVAMADDSGICVEALGGKPGVYSARFAGEDSTDQQRNEKLLEMMKEVPTGQRDAKFVCVIAVAFPNGKHFTVRGECSGEIAAEPKGENGFGYDPIFYVPEFKMTTAQMNPEQKHQISHRGRAMQKMKQELKKYL